MLGQAISGGGKMPINQFINQSNCRAKKSMGRDQMKNAQKGAQRKRNEEQEEKRSGVKIPR